MKRKTFKDIDGMPHVKAWMLDTKTCEIFEGVCNIESSCLHLHYGYFMLYAYTPKVKDSLHSMKVHEGLLNTTNKAFNDSWRVYLDKDEAMEDADKLIKERMNKLIDARTHNYIELYVRR